MLDPKADSLVSKTSSNFGISIIFIMIRLGSTNAR